MRVEDLIENYPKLYHMAARDSWSSIQRHGLWSTSALLQLYEVAADVRVELEERHRPNIVTISHPKFGAAQIRDQKPMSDEGLARALEDGLTARDWYRILNRKVFFWTSKARLAGLLSARAYKADEHDVLIVDTKSVIEAHGERVALCPMNSGATKPYPHPRGRCTFLPIAEYPWEEWRKKRGTEDAVVEVAFEPGIPAVGNYVQRVVRMKGNAELAVLFER